MIVIVRFFNIFIWMSW